MESPPSTNWKNGALEITILPKFLSDIAIFESLFCHTGEGAKTFFEGWDKILIFRGKKHEKTWQVFPVLEGFFGRCERLCTPPLACTPSGRHPSHGVGPHILMCGIRRFATRPNSDNTPASRA
jgi:hypothetical protein